MATPAIRGMTSTPVDWDTKGIKSIKSIKSIKATTNTPVTA